MIEPLNPAWNWDRVYGKRDVTDKDYHEDSKTNPQWIYGLEPTEGQLIQHFD